MSFFGLGISTSGLFASQRSLEIISHNVSNANTRGYTRQRLEQSSSFPVDLGSGLQGTGVMMDEVTQIRDEFLDITFRRENTELSYWASRNLSLSQVEAMFNEPSKNSIRNAMDELFKNFDEVAKNPDDLTVRTTLREKTIAFTDVINNISSKVREQVKDLDYEIADTITTINTFARDIAAVNEEIRDYEGANTGKANDLRDKRNVLIDDLSQYANIDVNIIKEDSGNGIISEKLNININGQTLVYGNDYEELSTSKKVMHDSLPEMEVAQITYANGSYFDTKGLGGILGSKIELRDNGENDEVKGLCFYSQKLDEFVKKFATEVNIQHRQGYGLDYNSTGINFFEANGTSFEIYEDGVFGAAGVEIKDPQLVADEFSEIVGPLSENSIKGLMADAKANGISEEDVIRKWEELNDGFTLYQDESGNWMETTKITAQNISISDEILNDVDNIAAASEYITNEFGEPIAKENDGKNMSKLFAFREKDDMFEWGTPEEFVKSLVSNLGVDRQEAIRSVKNKEVTLQHTDMQRQSISGVSIDEEMGNMIKFQHAYSANARMITTMDEMLDVIVNRMGRVGL
ncbi:flagellar hook-associated protein FlgK [Peptostreptococcaceae bacterium AGR-M142]